MKKLLFSVAMLAFAVVSCSRNEDLIKNGDLTPEPMTISILADGLDINYSPLSVSRSTTAEDLLAVQVYSGDQPVAKGLVRDWSSLSFEGFSNTEYTVVATMVVDATEVITESGGTYALPFNAEIVDNLEPSSEAFEGLELSTATLANHSDAEYSTPDIDRYFGEQSKTVTKSNATITTQMKRMSFGVSFDGIDEDLTLTIAGAPTVTLSIGELALFSFNDIEAAYTTSESSTPYTEAMDISVTYKGVTTDYEGVVFQRNMEAEIEFVDGGFSFDFEESGIIRVLTFEDDDYKAGENYIGESSWSSLIDSYYYGPLLYSDDAQYTWTDTNNTFLNGVVNEGYGWVDPWPIVYYFSAGGIVVSNHYTAVVTGTEVTYDYELSVPNGSAGAAGNNGSANFAVVMDGAASGMGSAPYLTFGDGTARTIDHLYISATSYLASVALDGNGFSDPLGAEDTFTITATGYDAAGAEIGSTTYELADSGALVDGWNRWDLRSLGKVVKVKFSITSSVEATWGGMSLPTYFAIDDVAVVLE